MGSARIAALTVLTRQPVEHTGVCSCDASDAVLRARAAAADRLRC